MKTTLRDLKKTLDSLPDWQLDDEIIKFDLNTHYEAFSCYPAVFLTDIVTCRTLNTMSVEDYNKQAFENDVLETVPIRNQTVHITVKIQNDLSNEAPWVEWKTSKDGQLYRGN
jgi:hypothetical protein